MKRLPALIGLLVGTLLGILVFELRLLAIGRTLIDLSIQAIIAKAALVAVGMPFFIATAISSNIERRWLSVSVWILITLIMETLALREFLRTASGAG